MNTFKGNPYIVCIDFQGLNKITLRNKYPFLNSLHEGGHPERLSSGLHKGCRLFGPCWMMFSGTLSMGSFLSTLTIFSSFFKNLSEHITHVRFVLQRLLKCLEMDFVLNWHIVNKKWNELSCWSQNVHGNAVFYAKMWQVSAIALRKSPYWLYIFFSHVNLL